MNTNDVSAMVTHESTRIYFNGKWYQKDVAIVKHPNYSGRLTTMFVALPVLPRKWYWGEWRIIPHTRVDLTPNVKTPFLCPIWTPFAHMANASLPYAPIGAHG